MLAFDNTHARLNHHENAYNIRSYSYERRKYGNYIILSYYIPRTTLFYRCSNPRSLALLLLHLLAI